MKKKGSWGSKKTQRDEVTTVRNVGTTITTGGDLTLVSEGDQLYQKARLESGADLTLESGGAITFEAVKDLDQESHEKSNDNAFWTSMEGKGKTDETLRQSVLLAQGETVIKAVDGLNIDIKHIDKKTVSQTIDAMVKAEPELTWMKEAELRGDVDWRQVREIHESFKYEHSGLGPASQLIIAIALSAIMGPMMAGLNGMVQAGAISVATKTTVSTINNRGNLGAIAKDITSSDSIKGYASSVATAGVGQQIGFDPSRFNAKDIALKVTADTVVKTAIYGGSFSSNLVESALGNAASVGGALGANAIGDLPLTNGSLSKIVLHAALGGLMAEAMGGDFRSGAIAAGANEALVAYLGDKLLPNGLEKNSPEYLQATQNLLAASQIVGVLASVVANGDVSIGAAVAANATQHNYIKHQEVDRLAGELVGCRGSGDPTACRADVEKRFRGLSDSRQGTALFACKEQGTCEQQIIEAKAGTARLDWLHDELGAKRFSSEELDIISRFQDSNFDDQRLAKQAANQVNLSFLEYLLVRSGLRGGSGSHIKGSEPAGGTKAPETGLISGETKVVGGSAPAANDASFIAPRPSGWTSISSDARAVVRDVESHSGVQMSASQRAKLADELRQSNHTYVAPKEDYQALVRQYNSQRNNLKREWEQNTGLTWPKTTKGVDYQAHHVIPQQYGGPNQWWNLHPVPGGSAHQGGVHAPSSPTTIAFPQKPPRQQ